MGGLTVDAEGCGISGVSASTSAWAGAARRPRTAKLGSAPPSGEAEFQIRYACGIDRSAEILDLATKDGVGVVDRNGSWFVHEGERLGQGREKAVESLDRQPELREKIVAQVLERLRGPSSEVPAVKKSA